MTKPVLAALVIAPTVVVAFVACTSGGSDGSSGGAGAVSSVDSSKNLSSLSDEEAKQYCEDAQNYQKGAMSEADRNKANCALRARIVGTFGAKDDAEAQAKCKSELDACLASPPDTADAGASANACDSFKARLASCNVTVGEASQCVADEATALEALAAGDPCAGAKAVSPDAGFTADAFFEEPESCKALEARCPSLFGGAASPSPAGG